MNFKFIDKMTLDDSGFNVGPVPITAFLGGDTESHQVNITKGIDYNSMFGFDKTTKQILPMGSTGAFIIPGQKLAIGAAVDILLGPVDANLTSTLTDATADEFIIYDLLTNKPFTSFAKVNSNTVHLGAYDYQNNVLVYRTSTDEERFLKVSPRYTVGSDWSIVDNTIELTHSDFVVDNQLTFMNNPLSQVELLWCDKEDYKNWTLYLPRKIELGPNSTILITPTGAGPSSKRHKYIEKEHINKVRSRLLQTNHRGLDITGDGSFSNNTESINYEYGYIKLYDKKEKHYNKVVWDIDPKRGYLLLEDPAKDGLLIDYKVDDSWFPFDSEVINMNPLRNNVLTYYVWIHNTTHRLYYSNSNNKSLLFENNTFSNTVVLTNKYSHLFTVSTVYKDSQAIDIRQHGGVLKNQDGAAFDIKSHTTLGYWGYEPTPLNIVLVDLPDNILENMIDQFNEKGATAYDLAIPASMQEDRQTAVVYLNEFEDENGVNLIQNEIFEAVGKYMPLGIAVIVRDQYTNVLFGTEDSALLTTSHGL